MIQANELRIGNYISYKNERWIKVGYHEIRYAVLYPDNSYYPIPLTPEILEKAGFVKTGRYAIGAGGYITYEKDRVVLLHPKKGHPFVLAFHETQVQSVHQLQNLYFALTGEELPINMVNQVIA